MKTRFKSVILGACALGALSTSSINAMDRQETDRQQILERFSQGNFTLPTLDTSTQRIVIQFGDPGFDGSDVLEEIAAYTVEKDAIIINVTNLWKPNEKAVILELIAKQMGRTENVYFCPGYGYYADKDQEFSQIFPAWPKANFGDAQIYNLPLEQSMSDNYKGIYNEQLTAYCSQFSDVDASIKAEQDPINFIKKVIEPFGENYVLELFVTGPTGDAARLLADEELLPHVRLLRGVMGGGFGKFGAESRLGYNFVIDPVGTKSLIEQIKCHNIPTLVVTSQTCTTIPIQKDDFTKFMASPDKTMLGEAVAMGWNNWNNHMSLKRNSTVVDYNICDLLTFMLSYHPEHIGQVARGYYNIYAEEAVNNGIHMLSPDAKKLFDTVIDEESPLFFVEEIDNPAILYKILMDTTIGQLINKKDTD